MTVSADNFTGTLDSDLGGRTASGGWTWAQAGGVASAARINASNQLKCNTTGTPGGGFLAQDTGSPDHYAQGTDIAGDIGPFPLVVRMLDRDNYGAALRLTTGGTVLQVWQRNGGSATQILSNTTVTGYSASDVWRLEVSGSTGQVYRNGTAFGSSFTVSVQSTRQTAGIHALSALRDPLVDNFEAGPLSSGSNVDGDADAAISLTAGADGTVQSAGAAAATASLTGAAAGTVASVGSADAQASLTASASASVAATAAAGAQASVTCSATAVVSALATADAQISLTAGATAAAGDPDGAADALISVSAAASATVAAAGAGAAQISVTCGATATVAYAATAAALASVTATAAGTVAAQGTSAAQVGVTCSAAASVSYPTAPSASAQIGLICSAVAAVFNPLQVQELTQAGFRAAAVAALKLHVPLVQGRVHSGRIWPIPARGAANVPHTPALLVDTPRTRRRTISDGGSAPSFQTTITLTVTARVERRTAAEVEALLDQLHQQIGTALLAVPGGVREMPEEWTDWETIREVESAEQCLGQDLHAFDCRFTETFEPTGLPPLTSARLVMDAIEPFDRLGNHPAIAPFPAPAAPPRLRGPDGQAEAEFHITFPGA